MQVTQHYSQFYSTLIAQFHNQDYLYTVVKVRPTHTLIGLELSYVLI